MQQRSTWPGPPSAPPPELLEEEPQRWQIGVDVDLPWHWNARERVLIESMENCLRRNDNVHVGSIELEHFLLSPVRRSASCSLRNMRVMKVDERGSQCWRQKKVRRRKGGERTFLRSPARKSGQDLQGVAGSHRVHEKRSRLLETRERKQMLLSGALGRNPPGRESSNDVMVLENKMSEVEN